MPKKLRAGILAATGTIGQRFIAFPRKQSRVLNDGQLRRSSLGPNMAFRALKCYDA